MQLRNISILLFAVAVAQLMGTATAQCSNYSQTFGDNLLLRVDDAVRVVALPFAFPCNGATYTAITVSSNGWIKLGASTSTNNDAVDSEVLMLNSNGEPRIAVCWDDLDPTIAPAGVFYAPGPTSVSVVWQNTPRFLNSPTTFANCECILDSAGTITLHWDASCTFDLSTSSSIVGISKGNNSVAAGTHLFDWSAIAPNTPVVDGTGYQLFTANTGTAPFDLTGASGVTLQFVPDSSTPSLDDYLATVGVGLTACPATNFGPVASTASSPIGTSCGSSVPPNVPLFEQFTANTGTNPIDLAGSSIRFRRAGNEYLTQPGLGFDSSYTATLGFSMPDDSLTVQSVGPMGSFALGVGTAVTQVAASSNGFVWLDATQLSTSSSSSAGALAVFAPRVAPLWFDLDFSAAGAGLFYWNTGTDYLGSGLAYAQGTWENVREFQQTTSANTFQVTLVANGDVFFAYGSLTGSLTHVAITGISGGSGVVGSPVDLVAGGSTSTLGPVAVTGGLAPVSPISHTVVPARLGQSLTLNASCPITAQFGVFGIGLTNPNIPLDLLFGPGAAPGCFLYTDATQDLFLSVPIVSRTMTWTPYAPVPVLLHLAGIVAYTQAAAFVPGVNPTNLLSSNGMTFRVGF